ncbi:MAG: hypothetical protein IPI65_01720 [Bacteroidetes bacterium]|nr:hypothetical protein [Bacteroidota bacterium]
MSINGRYFNQLNGVTIKRVATAFPDGMQLVSNTAIHELLCGPDWEKIFADKNYDSDFIKNTLGYESRYWSHVPGTPIVKNELTAADLMIKAAQKVIRESNILPDTIDMVISVTVTSPFYTNSTGTYVAGKLGLSCPAMEIKTGCASVIYAIVLAAQFIRSGARNVLITAGETPTKVTDKEGNLIYAVGDAGAALILTRANDNSGIGAAFLGADGTYSGVMGSQGLLPPNQDDLNANGYDMKMSKETDQIIQQAWQEIPQLLYQSSGLTKSDIDYLIPHQVNKKILDYAIASSGIARENTVDVIKDYANCGSVGVLLALDAAYQQWEIIQNKKLMLLAVGGGISYGGLILNV